MYAIVKIYAGAFLHSFHRADSPNELRRLTTIFDRIAANYTVEFLER